MSEQVLGGLSEEDSRVAEEFRNKNRNFGSYYQDTKDHFEKIKLRYEKCQEVVKALEEFKKPVTGVSGGDDIEIITAAQEILERYSNSKPYLEAKTSREFSVLRDDLNTERSKNHLLENEEAYKQQAVNDARGAGVEVNYPPYTEPTSSPLPGDEQNTTNR